MGSTRAGGWVAGTVLLILAMFAATWFLLASPRFEATAETMDQVETTRAQNIALANEVTQLKADFENLDSYRAELADLRTQVPAAAELTDYVRVIQDEADGADVFVSAVTPGAPQAIEVVVPDTTTEDTTEDASVAPDGAAPEADAETAAAQALAQQLDGLVAVPISITVVGTAADTMDFVDRIQTKVDRLFLALTLDGARQQTSEGSGGLPATSEGDVEVVLSGVVYVLPEDPELAALQVSDEVVDDAPGTPELPSSKRNPFAPLS